MARTIVVYLLQLITTVIVWACALKTVAVLIAVIRSPELGASVDADALRARLADAETAAKILLGEAE